MRRALARRIRQVVPFDAWCCETIDPATLLVTSAVSEDVPAGVGPRVAENEYLYEDFNKYSVLARSVWPVGILAQSTQGDLARSRRYRDVMVPVNWERELRVAFVVDGSCWGAIDLFRRLGRPEFTADEAAWLARLSRHIALGLRVSLLAPSVLEERANGPGLVVVDDRGVPRAITPTAEGWLADLADGQAPARDVLPPAVHSVVSRVRALAARADTRDHLARLRVRTKSGSWLVLYGSRLLGQGVNSGDVGVVVEPAAAREMAPLAAQAYGLTRRERDVLGLVLGGVSSADIAETLCLSAYTVQDYLKAIFDKVGVRSRRDLVGRFLAEQYVPRRRS